MEQEAVRFLQEGLAVAARNQDPNLQRWRHEVGIVEDRLGRIVKVEIVFSVEVQVPAGQDVT